jgi:hypothetical protein
MDCDQVFMILTRGPFPAGEPTDDIVEAHLETCADCWRLAEALRPALEIFQEAVPAIEGRDLPGYWGDARPAAMMMAQRTGAAARLAPTAELRQLARPSHGYGLPHYALGVESAGQIWRAVFAVSALAAAAIGLVLLLRS